MSIAVQSNIANGAQTVSSLSCAFNSPNTGGNTIIAIGFFGTDEDETTSLTIEDSQNNNYSVLHGPDSNSFRASIIWRATKIAGGSNTLTVTPVGFSPAEIFLVVLEYPAGVCDGAIDQFVSNFTSGTSLSTGLTNALAQSGELAIAYADCFTSNNTYTAGAGWAIEQQAEGDFASAVVLDSQPSGTSAIEGTVTASGAGATVLFCLLTIQNGSGGGTGILANYNVGDTLSSGDQATIKPANVDRGSVLHTTVYSGTLRNWNGRTGIVFADSTEGDASLPTQHSGEGPLVRVQLADVTYSPNQGDRVKFALVHTSAGDKVAKAVSQIS